MLLRLGLLATAAHFAAAYHTACPDGYADLELEDNRCYHFSDGSNDTYAWTPAYVACQMTPHAEILTVLDPLHFYPMASITRQGGQDAWTGLINIGGNRSWADGTPYNPELDQFIAEPESDEMFGYISADDEMFHFADSLKVLAYICYVDVSPPTTTTPAPTVPPACPEGWTEYQDDGNCYLFSEDVQVWTSADGSCVDQDADLVSIHDMSLLTFLLISIGEDAYWTGLQNEDEEFVWADGTNTSDIGILTSFMDKWEVGKNCVAVRESSYPTSLVHEDCFAKHKYVCYKKGLNAYYDDDVDDDDVDDDGTSLYWFFG